MNLQDTIKKERTAKRYYSWGTSKQLPIRKNLNESDYSPLTRKTYYFTDNNYLNDKKRLEHLRKVRIPANLRVRFTNLELCNCPKALGFGPDHELYKFYLNNWLDAYDKK